MIYERVFRGDPWVQEFAGYYEDPLQYALPRGVRVIDRVLQRMDYERDFGMALIIRNTSGDELRVHFRTEMAHAGQLEMAALNWLRHRAEGVFRTLGLAWP